MNRKNKKSISIIIKWVLMISWMSLIFYMSNQNGVQSTQNSDFVADLLSYIGIGGNERIRSIITFLIRKLAHFTEYLVLFILIFNVVSYYIKKEKNMYYLAIFILFLYACSDEIHQSFVPGRECAFRDVLIDTAGGLAACMLLLIIKKIKNKKFQ